MTHQTLDQSAGRSFDNMSIKRPSAQAATTTKGKPCNNAPQKGEQFCGPHLTQARARTAQDGTSDRR